MCLIKVLHKWSLLQYRFHNNNLESISLFKPGYAGGFLSLFMCDAAVNYFSLEYILVS